MKQSSIEFDDIYPSFEPGAESSSRDSIQSSATSSSRRSSYNENQSLDALKKSYEKLILSTGENINRGGLLKTPERAAKAFKFFTSGYQQELKGEFTILLRSKS